MDTQFSTHLGGMPWEEMSLLWQRHLKRNQIVEVTSGSSLSLWASGFWGIWSTFVLKMFICSESDWSIIILGCYKAGFQSPAHLVCE